MATSDLTFDQFRFDIANQCLWREGTMIALTPKAYAVLHCLLERPGQLVSKDELLDAVWPHTAVSDASLKVCVREIRRALGDPVAAPRFIATVHRRGYRFIGAVVTGVESPPTRSGGPSVLPRPAPQPSPPALVGRERELAALQDALDRALGGERQTVFITGEIGIGKTALIEGFVARAPAPAVVAEGRCLEHFGAGEAYLPLLEALGRLCRDPAASAFVALLRRRAPTWLAQMPWLITAADRDDLDHEIFGGTPERMLREVTEVLEALTAETPLLLVLEDLHWSDPSTLDAVARLTQRREPARLLVLATYRPVDAILADHPVKHLKQRLVQQPQCRELALAALTAPDVSEYLAARLGPAVPAGLAAVVHQRTDGNPLFLAMVVDELLADADPAGSAPDRPRRSGVEALAVPHGVRQLIEQQIERLAAEDVALLETAALARDDFPAALVAAGLGAEPLAVEERCERLARQRQWLQPNGLVELADGSVSGRYRFVHTLGLSVFADRVPAARRLRLHQRIGEWLEGNAGDHAATEAAMHFEASHDAVRAIRSLRAAARTATARHANREAVAGLTRALALVDRLPADSRAAARRALLQQRGLAHRTMGNLTEAVEDLGAWAAAAHGDGAAAEEVRALLALSAAWALRDRARALACADRAVECSRSAGDTVLHAAARGYAAYWFARVHGWRDGDAQASAEALALARTSGRPALLAAALGMHAYFANLQGDYGAAARDAAEGVVCAERGGDSFTHALCRYQQAWALLHAGDWGTLLHVLHGAIRAAERDDHRPWVVVFTLLLGWWAAHAGDPAGAAARAAECLRTAQELAHEYGIVLARLVSGWALLGLDEGPAARREFAAVADDPAQPPTAMEWLLRLPLHLGLSACALAERDAARAAVDAARVCALAAQPGERTFLALGHRALAETALLDARWNDAAAALAAAHAALAGGDAPIAEWQVWSTAAALADATGRPADAARDRGRSATVLDRLAASLDSVGDDLAAALGMSIATVQRSIRAQESRPLTRSASRRQPADRP